MEKKKEQNQAQEKKKELSQKEKEEKMKALIEEQVKEAEKEMQSLASSLGYYRYNLLLGLKQIEMSLKSIDLRLEQVGSNVTKAINEWNAALTGDILWEGEVEEGGRSEDSKPKEE